MSLSYLQTTLNSRLALPLKELDELSSYLTLEWELYCFAERTRGFTTFAESKKKGFKAFGELCAERADMMTDAAFETQSDALEFYTRLSKPPFGPWVMGARWPHILSSLAAVDELCTAIKPANVLEVGCGFGYAGRWLGAKHQINYLGIDFCYEAIQSGRDRANIAAQAYRHRKARAVGANPSVGFMKGDINQFPPVDPWGIPHKKYDLIFSIAGMPSEMDGALIDRISELLTPNGVIYIHVSGAPGFASRWKTKPTKLQLVFEDSLGGLANGNSGYEHTAGYLFAPKRSGLTPTLFHPLDSWHDFAECMNTNEIHARERNFAYFNSYGRRSDLWQYRPYKWEDILPYGFVRETFIEKPPAVENKTRQHTPEAKIKAKKPRKKSASRKLAETKKAVSRVQAREQRLERLLKELRKAKKRR